MDTYSICSARWHRIWLVPLVVGPLLLGAIGCESKPPRSREQQELGPSERFALIVKAVKDDLEGTTMLPAVGFGSRSHELTSQNTRRTIREELIEPTDSSSTYKGRITVETKTTYSSASRPSDNVEPEENVDEKPRGLSFGSLDEDDETDPFSALADSANPFATGRSSKPRPDQVPSSSSDSYVVRAFDNEWSKTFDLAYEDERWVLETEVEDDGIRAVFEAALKKQR